MPVEMNKKPDGKPPQRNFGSGLFSLLILTLIS
jgi:hypothetical protein